MKKLLLACAFGLAACSEPTTTVSVEVKTPVATAGGVKVYTSKRVEIDVPPEAAAAVAAEMRKDAAKL